MNIIIFTHPSFLGSQSMPRFANMLAAGMRDRGHNVKVWTPQPQCYHLPVPSGLKKWMGYIDQYLIFPSQVRRLLKKCEKDTLFVFTDQALGPWVPLVANRPHVIHCHDFLAQRSALGAIAENPTSSTGKKYQSYIRNGYRKGRNFISVSEKTKDDLSQFLSSVPSVSEVVYNGLNQDFQVNDVKSAQVYINQETSIDTSKGYILHVGGNQWYKNRVGVIKIYDAWRQFYNGSLPLMLIGALPNSRLMEQYQNSPYKGDIHFLTGKTDEFVRKAYNGAALFLFPSMAEGFGWPIAEAMASGCPVITTGEAPMTEVGGDVAWYIPRYPQNDDGKMLWAKEAAGIVHKLLALSAHEKGELVSAGIANAKRFDADIALRKIEEIYKQVLKQSAT